MREMRPLLIVMIPALNEESTIADAVGDIPRFIDSVSKVEILVIDDGSSDGTSQSARAAGADHVLTLPVHHGLGVAHRIGLNRALSIGADLIVNYDADLQYKGEYIDDLIAPIIGGGADVVIGNRSFESIPGYPPLKRWWQTRWSQFL